MSPTLKTRPLPLVQQNGIAYVCLPIFGRKVWRCGQCRRGVLHSWDKKCKVCKAKMVKL